jgi:Cu(I)/Ag(I) efflux system membrane fusion protein
MRFMPGDTLYQVADLSSVWVVADVFEQDIAQVRTGAMAKVRINAYPDKVFEGRVTYVYPTLNPETRTVPVRVELANPGQLLKPAMFAQVEVPVGQGTGRHRADLGRDRQRHPPDRPHRARRRAFRAAGREAGWA